MGSCRGALTLAILLLLVLVAIAAVVLFYTYTLSLAHIHEDKRLKALARVEEAVYYEDASGTPILRLYVRNVGKVTLIPDTVYLWGSPMIIGKPREYMLKTRVVTVGRSVSASTVVEPAQPRTETIYAWRTWCSNIDLGMVWGGDKWAIDLSTCSSERLEKGLIKIGRDITSWRNVSYNAATCKITANDDRVTISVASRDGGWATCAWRTSLSVNPPFVVEADVSRVGYWWQSNVAIYLTSRAQSSNPYFDYPFYEIGLFDYYYSGGHHDVLEARIRKSNGDVMWVNTNVEGDSGHIVIYVTGDGGTVYAVSDEGMGAKDFIYNTAPGFNYLWLVVETKSTYTRSGAFRLGRIKVYRGTSFQLILEKLPSEYKAVNVTLRATIAGNSVELSYLLSGSENAVTVRPEDHPTFYRSWVRYGYPADVTVESVKVLAPVNVTVKPRANLALTLSNIEVKFVNPPQDFDPSKVSVEATISDVQILDWKSSVHAEGGEYNATVSMILGNVTLSVVVRYEDKAWSFTVKIPVYREARKSVKTSNTNVVVPLDYGTITYDNPVILTVEWEPGATAGIAEDEATFSLGSYPVTFRAWRPYNTLIELDNVWGGDEWTIGWNGAEWSVNRTALGLVLNDTNPYDENWSFKSYQLAANKVGYNGWGGIEARRIDTTTEYPWAKYYKQVDVGSSNYVVEARLWKHDPDQYFTSLYLSPYAVTSDPWDDSEWILFRIHPFGSFQVGVKTGEGARWSSIGLSGSKATIVIASRGNSVEFWVWNTEDRSGDPVHVALSGAPSLTRFHIHLVHKYYGTSGSITTPSYSYFRDIKVYKGTSVKFGLNPSSEARVETVEFLDGDGNVLYVWTPSSQSETLTLDLAGPELREYWLSHGCPLYMRLNVSGYVLRTKSIDVDVNLKLRFRAFANFTIASYSREMGREQVRMSVKVLDYQGEITGINTTVLGDYVIVKVVFHLEKVKIAVSVWQGDKLVYNETAWVTVNRNYVGYTTMVLTGDDPPIAVTVYAYAEKDVTGELPGYDPSKGGVSLDLRNREEQLRIPPGELRVVEFVLSEPLERGHEYHGKLVFREGVEAWFEIRP